MDTTYAPDTKPIEIFRAGTHTAMNGQKYTFTKAQLLEMAESYRPEFADAPAVIGHPKLTSPRWARAKKLTVTDAGVLLAELEQVVPAFADAVEAKQYPNVSASIYLPEAPGNPVPGKYYLRHIGFLGGAAPAVKGLAQVEFGADESGVLDFAYADSLIVRMFRSLKNWLIERDGVDSAEKVISDYDLEYLVTNAQQVDPDFAAPALPPQPQPTPEAKLNEAELAAQKKQLEDQAAKLAAREAALAEQERAAQLKGNADFAAALVEKGQLLPGEQPAVLTILARLSGVDDTVAEFAAGDERATQAGADLLRGLLQGLPPRVTFERVSPIAADAPSGVASFAAPDGYGVDPDGAALLAKVKAYQAAHPGVSFDQALAQFS